MARRARQYRRMVPPVLLATLTDWTEPYEHVMASRRTFAALQPSEFFLRHDIASSLYLSRSERMFHARWALTPGDARWVLPYRAMAAFPSGVCMYPR